MEEDYEGLVDTPAGFMDQWAAEQYFLEMEMSENEIEADSHSNNNQIQKGGANNMAMYMAAKIMDGQQSYAKVFSIKMYQRYQDDVDAILISEGKEELIVK